jgi:hypothetical protein
MALERVDLMLKTKLSKSARAERRACASSAASGIAEPTSAGARLIAVAFMCEAISVRWLLIIGTA